jgi:hypothetical protein
LRITRIRGGSAIVSYYRPEVDGLPEMGLVGRQLWAQSPSSRPTVRPLSLTPLHAVHPDPVGGVGFCGFGEAYDFIADGAIEIGRRQPIDPGGQLGEARIHGLNGIAEGMRLLCGTPVNQVPDVDRLLVTPARARRRRA